MTSTPTGDKFVMIRHSVQDYGLTPQAFTIYAAMVRRADWSTRETYVSRGTLAEVIGTKQPRSADKYVRELIEAGLVTSVRHRWTTQARDMDDIVYVKDDEHPVQTSSLYALAEAPAVSPQVGPQCATAHGGGALQRTGVVRQNAHNQEPLIQNPFTEEMKSARTAEPTRGEMAADEGMSTAQARAWLDGEATKDPHPLHPEWAPNRRHRDEATELGLDADTAAESFRRAMLDADQHRRRWGAAFTEYLRAEADGTAAATFEVDDDALAAQAVEAAAKVWRDDPWGGLPVAASMDVVPAPSVPAFVPEAADVEDQDQDEDEGRRWVAQTEVDEHAPAADVEAEREQVAQMFAEDAAVTEAKWQADLEERRIAANLQKINRRLTVVKLRAAEKVEAAEMLRNGMRNDDVYAAIIEARKARRAELTAAA